MLAEKEGGWNSAGSSPVLGVQRTDGTEVCGG